MPSTPTTRNRLEKQGTGENLNTWGAKLNSTGLDLIDAAIDGRASFTLSGSKTLSSTNYAADEARMRFLDITSGTGGTVTIPAVEKLYGVRNNTSGDVIITTGSGDTATVKSGNTTWVGCDGTNVRLFQAADFGAVTVKSTAVPSADGDLVNKLYADGLSFSTALPAQTGNSGKFITTDGTSPSWASLTKSSVGLSNVDNTADSAKPVSTAQQTALDAKANKTISVSGGTGLTGGGTLEANRTITADIASQAEAVAGSSSTKLMTPQRVAQAIDAQTQWTLLSTTTIAGTAASVIQTGLSGYQDVLVLCSSVGHNNGSSTFLQLYYSTNNGSSYTVPVHSVTGAAVGTGAATESSSALISNIATGYAHLVSGADSGSLSAQQAAIGSAITAIKLQWNAGSFDEGTVRIFAR